MFHLSHIFFSVLENPFRLLLILCFAVLSCEPSQPNTLFQERDAAVQGIEFQNTVHSTYSLNILTYMYYYNGGGVAVGDIDGDGLEDLFFAGNQVSSRLYRNQGDLRFEDITTAAGTATDGWVSGVSMVDINADGWLDIYACRTAHRDVKLRQNLLFINQQDGTFLEMAKAYGLADTAYSTHSAFFDYDQDGDLDVYLLNHMHQFSGANDPNPRKPDGSALNTDRLLRNDSQNGPHPTFTDVSREAGILHDGFGLGIAIADLNEDNWPDIYVSNDFISNDLMYLNNQDGTFTNQIAQALSAQSHNGMGNDIADINQDALPDIFVADMLPETNARRKSMIMNTGYDLFQLALRVGYEPQYTRNTLQLNLGNGHFSEIAQLAGIHSTDWSWSPLFGDYDNDGDQDLLITNGHFKDLTDLDFIAYRRKRIAFTTQAQRDSLYLRLLEQVKGIHLKNYLYENKGTLQFQDKSKDWGIRLPSYSNGAVKADLDRDGDLDLVINNLNEPISLYENQGDLHREKENWLQLTLKGPDSNPAGIGTKVWLYVNGAIQYQEQFLSRGFMSSSSPILHMGLGNAAEIDSLRVRWPDGNTELLQKIAPDQLISLHYAKAIPSFPSPSSVSAPMFIEKSQQSGLDIQLADPPTPVFKQEPLLPHSYAQQGPAVAIGDINGDGRDDLYAGGAAGISGHLFFQTESGTFQEQVWAHNTAPEEVAACFFDADGDTDLDLYVVSGGSEYWAGSGFYQDRLYRNNGSGQFTWDSLALPEIRSSGSCVTASDFDQDGDLDLFVGGRVIPGKYAAAPRSYLLLNQGGNFEDATQQYAVGLDRIGMVSAALWTDTDQDGWSDLMLVGEWMPITVFNNHEGKLSLAPIADFQFTSGWWNSLAAGDFDGDGDTDYVAGNLGLNTDFQASVSEPLTVTAGFLDGNRSWDAILSSYEKGEHGNRKAFPIHPRDELLSQMPSLEKEFPDYQRYAKADMEAVLAVVPSKDSVISHSAFLLSSSYIENLGKNEFLIRPLPITAQFSPVFGLFPTYLDSDPYLDLVIVGNFWGSNVRLGRYDASIGAVFAGNGSGRFMEIPPEMTGFSAIGDVRSVYQINRAPELPYWIVFRNNDTPLIYEPSPLAHDQVNFK